MRESPKVLIALLLAALASSVSLAAVEVEQRQDGRLDQEGVVPLPRPVPFAPEVGSSDSVIGSGFQLVGFTTQVFDGTRGILNHTLACQAEFPGSRICAADDIRLTINVPPAPGAGFAWVDVPPSREVSNVRVNRVDDEIANCRGWRSSATTDSGMAMDLAVAYGSLVKRTCDQALRLACCAAN